MEAEKRERLFLPAAYMTLSAAQTANNLFSTGMAWYNEKEEEGMQ